MHLWRTTGPQNGDARTARKQPSCKSCLISAAGRAVCVPCHTSPHRHNRRPAARPRASRRQLARINEAGSAPSGRTSRPRRSRSGAGCGTSTRSWRAAVALLDRMRAGPCKRAEPLMHGRQMKERKASKRRTICSHGAAAWYGTANRAAVNWDDDRVGVVTGGGEDLGGWRVVGQGGKPATSGLGDLDQWSEPSSPRGSSRPPRRSGTEDAGDGTSAAVVGGALKPPDVLERRRARSRGPGSGAHSERFTFHVRCRSIEDL